MTTSSEDVLLLVSHVKHQKKDGTLYLMAERVAWIMQSRDVFSVSHKYADIKNQKISPDGKAKVQLQVVLHNGAASTFHFTHPDGVDVQLKDRNDVKELLQQLLPKFKWKVNKELEEKNRMLAEDPELLQLYRDLVTSQVITAEDFWADHAKQHAAAKPKEMQDIGVSGAFLAEVKPQTDGCNGLKYNLKPDTILSIFKTYPAVKRKHLDYVPDKMTESEFWTRFFQSHYFHRDRLNIGSKDVFTECAKHDEQDIKQELQRAVQDPLLDITSFMDSSLEDGYGQHSKDNVSASTSGLSQGTLANRSLIRRFNHHSMMVLKVCENESNPVVMVGGPVTNQSQGKSALNGEVKSCEKAKDKLKSNGPKNCKSLVNVEEENANETQSCEPRFKKSKLQGKIVYEDLVGEGETTSSVLNLCKKERYLHGPTMAASMNYLDTQEMLQAAERLKQEMHNWTPDLPHVLSSNNAVSVLQDLSPGGALMKGTITDNLSQSVPEDVQAEMRNLYSALCELLRHFWLCFPITTKVQQEKALRVHASLERFQYSKLNPFQDRLLRDHLSTNLTDHMTTMLDTAYVKFSNWQSRRVALK